jgi:hypothetical protein
LHGCFNQDKRSASVISTNTLDILVLIDTKELYLASELGRRRYDAQRNEQKQIDDSVKKKQKKTKSMGLSPDAWASIGTTLFNTGSTLYANQQNRKWALQDWERQNRFNAPKQQMQRFKEAGLNPNLIYTQKNEAGPVRSTDYVAPQAPDFQGVLSKSAQIKLQDQQLVNAQLQNEAIQAQILKTKADALYVASNTKFKDLDVARLAGQLPGLVEGVQLRNEATKQEIANKVADTNNKISQLDLQGYQKAKLLGEIDKLFRTNAFIELSENQRIAVQKAIVESTKAATQLSSKKYVTEDFNQQKLYADLLRTLRTNSDVPEDFTDKILGIIKGLIPKF